MANRFALPLAFVFGLLAPFAFAPYNYWLLAPVSIIGLHYLLLRSTRPFVLGFSYGLGWFGYGISWVHVSMDRFGGMPLIASLALMGLLAAYLALYPALACWLINKWQGRKQLRYHLLWVPACWIVVEWLRSWMLTGFPWLQFGYSQVSAPLAGFAPLFGVLGLTALLLVSAGCILLICLQGIGIKQRYFAAMILSMVMMTGAGLRHVQWTQVQEPIKVALVQGNVSLDIKWLPEHFWPTLEMYQQETLSAEGADVIVWPESAIAAFEHRVVDYLHTLNDLLLEQDKALITGVLAHDLQQNRYYNSLVTLGEAEADDSKGYYYEHANRYHKHHLLPIGEFVPFESLLRPLAPFFNLPMSSFDRGDTVQNNLVVKGHHWLAAICYEIAFPELLRGQFSEQTDAIITVSNDAWFGDSIGPWQHLEIAQMRALEFGRPVVRSTNTGHTALIDRFGKITARAPIEELHTLVGEVEPATGSTPYQDWGRWPIWLFASLGLLAMLSARRAH